MSGSEGGRRKSAPHGVTRRRPTLLTDGMKRAFRSFGGQFGNDFYGDQPAANNQASAPKPERTPAQANGNGKTGQSQSQAKGNGRSAQTKADGKPAQPQTEAKGRADSQADKLRKRLFEIASEQGLEEDQVRTAVVDRTGKSIDDLTAEELGPLVEAAANKLRQMKQEQAKAA